MFSQGYVGVSTNIQSRWHWHSRYSDNSHLKAAIKKYGWDNLIKEVVVISEDAYCYNLEEKIRPFKKIGWNIAEGGKKPPKSLPRGKDYKSPLRGIKKETPWMFGRKVSDKEKQLASERKKVKVKYKNTVYESFGELANFLGLKFSTLANRIYRNPQKWGYEVIK
jgi:hypothetical protein